jgi:hypothetical protein
MDFFSSGLELRFVGLIDTRMKEIKGICCINVAGHVYTLAKVAFEFYVLDLIYYVDSEFTHVFSY